MLTNTSPYYHARDELLGVVNRGEGAETTILLPPRSSLVMKEKEKKNEDKTTTTEDELLLSSAGKEGEQIDKSKDDRVLGSANTRQSQLASRTRRCCFAIIASCLLLIINALILIILNASSLSTAFEQPSAGELVSDAAEMPRGENRVDDDIVGMPEPPELSVKNSLRESPLKRSYLEDDAEYLQNLSCLPRVCSDPKHFIVSPKLLANPRGFTLLVSFPGSGNTWTRSISKYLGC